MKDVNVLKEFLSFSLEASNEVFEKFSDLPNVIKRGTGFEKFLYYRGSRDNKVLLVAHTDTYWSDCDDDFRAQKNLLNLKEKGIIKSGNNNGYGLGADDRAGCAIIWLLRDLGHSILLLDGEEKGRLGSNWLMSALENEDIAEEINNAHQFMIQFDRRNGTDFKCYDVGTKKFRKYIREKTNYNEPDRRSFTDICTLCSNITGVNLSVGYYNEHRQHEYLKIDEWQHTLDICRVWLADDTLPKFNLN